MSQTIGTALNQSLEARLSRGNSVQADRAIVLCSIDGGGFAHPAMLSCREFFAVDARTVRMLAAASSKTAANLRERRQLTAILADVDGVFYIKARVIRVEEDARQTIVDAEVIEVLEDVPTADEATRITSGIRFQRLEDDQSG